MEEAYCPQGHNLLAEKMIEAFGDELNALSLEYQEILVDELVTIFQNRIEMFSRIQSKHGR